jgi:hypothetical protein
MNPKYPVFIPTKGRFSNPLTIKAFDILDVAYKAVIEEQEYDDYVAVIDPKKIIVLPHRDKGLTVTRNWIWDYAMEKGFKRFWTFDDNIRDFYRLHKNIKWRFRTKTFLRVIEDFADRYTNVPIVGMEYEMFRPRKEKTAPYRLNARVYSNMLIEAKAKDSNGNYYRNECFYNDDTDLCIRVLKDGYCTILFQTFLADKMPTMQHAGGMTDYYNKTDKRKQFAQELIDKHPDIVKMVWRYNRWHHEVDYRSFRRNKLIMKPNLNIPEGVNNYGMILKTIEENESK